MQDAKTGEAEQLAATGRSLVYSDWTAAEFASAVGGLARRGDLTPAALDAAERSFAEWRRRDAASVSVQAKDVVRAEQLCRRRDLKLRTPDALHLAIVLRLGVALATFDIVMADAAVALGIDVLPARV